MSAGWTAPPEGRSNGAVSSGGWTTLTGPRRKPSQRAGLVAVAGPVPQRLDGLYEEFREILESAVDPLEIASALEFDGMSDSVAQKRYGCSDVFELADQLYGSVPRRPADPPPPTDPWQFSKFRPVVQGLLYGLPALCFPAARGLLVGPGVLPMLVVALLAAWSLSQGLAALGFIRVGHSAAGEGEALLRTGAAFCLAAVVAALAMCDSVVHARLSVLLFGAGEGAYMLGACVLMVLGHGRWLFLALAPGVAFGAAFLALGRPPGFAHVVWAALAAVPLMALISVHIITRPKHPPTGPLCTMHELLASLPAFTFGLIAAGLLAYPVAAGLSGHGGINTGALLASLPISLSMGSAEASLLWYRRRVRRLLRTTTDLTTFARKSRAALCMAVLQYVGVAGALVMIVIAVAVGTGLVQQPSRVELVQVATYLALGVAMFLALTLQALGLRAFALTAGAMALGCEISLRGLGISAQVVACGGLLLAVMTYAMLRLGQALRHL